MNQREQRKTHENNLPVWDPPSSPLTTILLSTRKTRHVMATQMKTITLNPRDPAGT